MGAAKLDDYVKVDTVSSAADLFATLASNRFSAGRWAFRGEGSTLWRLEPSLERFARSIAELPWHIEEYAIREFQRRAHHYTSDLPEGTNSLEWLALMRHHGSPTRLLDFTKSPYVAAFFAATDAARDAPATIWAIDVMALRKHAAEILKSEGLALWVAEVGKQCLQGGSFSDPNIFNALIRPVGGPMPSVVAPVEPFRFNKRMVLQQGLFLCPFWIEPHSIEPHSVSFEDALVNVLNRARSSAPGDRDLLHKLVIEPTAHPHVLRELYRMNVNYSSLFPDLDGLARTISSISVIRAATAPPPRLPDYEFDMSP